MKTRIALALCTSLALAACSSTPSSDADAATSETAAAEAPASGAASSEGHLEVTCNVDPAEKFEGQKISDAFSEQARTAAGAATVRVIRPNQPVTMDYRGDRLNIILDDNDMVVDVNCG